MFEAGQFRMNPEHASVIICALIQAKHKVLACFAGVLGLELGLSEPVPKNQIGC